MMLNMIEFAGSLELGCSWAWKVAKISSNFMESFTARANPQNGLRAVLQDLYESLEMFVLVDYMYFADLVKEFAFEARTLPPKRVTETCEALFSNADLLQSFRNARVNFARFALESMIPEICAAGINVMCGDNDSDLLQIIEFERQAWSFKERWCEMWATVCEFTGHSNQREDGQNILVGVVSLSVAQGCKMEKKERKDEQMIASARGQTMSCHSLYINRIMRLSMPYDAAPSKIAALANALQTYVWEIISSNERSKATRIMCTSTVTPNGIRSTQTRSTLQPHRTWLASSPSCRCILTVLGQLCGFMDRAGSQEDRCALACPAWSVRTIEDASMSTMTVSTLGGEFFLETPALRSTWRALLEALRLPTEVEERRRTRPFDARRACGTFEASHQSGSQVRQTPYGGSPCGCRPNVQRGLWGHATQAQETS